MKSLVRVGWFCLFALVGLVALAASAEARSSYVSAGHACDFGVGEDITGVHMDADKMYAGRHDGRIVAVDRSSGVTAWTYPTDFAASQTEHILDIFGDSTKIYAAVFDAAGLSPLVAIDKATGQRIWSQTFFEGNPLKVTGDDTFLYAAFPGGVIVKLNKETGDVLQPVYRPAVFRDPNGLQFKNSTNAISVRDGVLWASHAWSQSRVGSEGNNIDYFHRNHTVVRLQTSTMVGEEYRLQEDEDEHEDPIYPLVNSIWIGPNSIVYMSVLHEHAGSIPQDNHIIAFSAGVPASDSNFGTQQASPRVLAALDGININGAAGNYLGQTFSGLGFASLAYTADLRGDATHLYAALEAGSHAANPQSGGVFRITLANPGANTGMNPAPFGATPATTLRLTDWFHAYRIYVDQDPNGGIALGHRCFDPAIRDQHGPKASLLIELPKNDEPAVILMSPTGGEMLDGLGYIALKTNIPGVSSTNMNRLKVDFYVSSTNGLCDDATSCYVRMSPHITDDRIPANAFRYWAFVPFDYPEFCDSQQLNACQYRFKVIVTDTVTGKTASDVGESFFVVDKTPPIIHRVEPAAQTVLTNGRIKLSIDTGDSLTGIDPMATGFCYDVTRGGVCLSGAQAEELGINDYVFDYRNNGFDIYPKRSAVSQQSFSDGPHIFRVDVVDYAGNRATKSWEIFVDRGIATPEQPLQPLPESWVHDRRPIITAQFWEPVEVIQAHFGGVNVTTQLEVLPPDPATNPLGTRFIFRPAEPIAVGTLYRFEIDVRDRYGNRDLNAAPWVTSVRVDSEAPQFSGLMPAHGSLLTEERPEIVFSVDDRGSRIIENSLSVFLDGKDISSRMEKRPNNFWVYRPEIALQGGQHVVTSAIVDAAGNLATAEWNFLIDLSAPTVVVSVELPPDQIAVKKGDQVTVKVRVTDDSEIRNVRVNGRGLDPKLSTAKAPTPIAGQPGNYEMVVTVTEIRSRPTVEVAATAEDVGGHVGYHNTTVQLDNVAPEARLKELPSYVGASFTLEWEEKIKDLGSGVSYYRLERQENAGEWKVIRPRLNGTSLDLTYPEGQFTTLNFRISAIDGAGNIQSIPSNVATTVVRGDPFEATGFKKNLPVGVEQEFTATPLTTLSLENAAVSFRFTGPNNVSIKRDMEPLGRLYRTHWNVSGVAPGDYILLYTFRDKDGFEMASEPYAVKVVPVDFEEVAGALGNQEAKSLPTPAFAPGLIALVGVATLVRLRANGKRGV